MLAAALLAVLAAAAPPTTLPPIDQCNGDASFTAFREELREVVKRRDSPALLAVLHDEVLVDLGGGQGKEAFAAQWSLSEPATSSVWDELDKALSLGCALSGEVRLMPSMVAQLDPEVDAFETLVASGPAAVLRQSASDESELLAALHWDVLTVLSWPDAGDFVKVRRGDQAGYVRLDQVRSPLDFRLTIERVQGRWVITTFTGGD